MKRENRYLLSSQLTVGVTVYLLAGCAGQKTPTVAAPISQVGTGGGELVYTAPPTPPVLSPPAATTASSNAAAPVSAATPATVNRSPAAAPSQSSAPVTTQNGAIVYNRSYDTIPKGSYTGETYTVKRGDTLFYIAWITGNDYRDLAQRNQISEPYNLHVGQRLKVSNSSGGTLTGENALSLADVGSANKNATTKIQNPATNLDQSVTNSYSGKANSGTVLKQGSASTSPVTASSVSESRTSAIAWRWPAQGKIVEPFSASPGGNKGIDIAGSRGQPVIATAGGRVVYAGNALRGYGNLIIIKHNDDYLSAYAHNDAILVREQQVVNAGQKIATMGSTGTSSVRLHFEIRYKGKSVNPLRFLPQR